MAYIGKIPATGNFVKLDAISVVNGQAGYTMQSGSANFTPESANHMLVSLNGVIQAPLTSFTVSGSTITFASGLSTGDVIDFIMVYGNVLDIGTPSDDTVSTAKLQANAVTTAKITDANITTAKIANDAVDKDKVNLISTSSSAGLEIKGDGTSDGYLQLNCSQNSHGIKLKSPSHSSNASYTLTFPTTDGNANEFLQSNGSGVLSFATAGGGMWSHISTTTVSSAVAQVDFTSLSSDYVDFCVAISGFHQVADNTELYFRFFDHTGTIKTDTVYKWSFTGSDTGSLQVDNQGDTLIRLGRPLGASATENASLELIAYNVHDINDAKNIIFSKSYFNAAGEFGQVHGGGGYVSDAGSGTFKATGMRFYQQSGNIASGKFALYGRKLA